MAEWAKPSKKRGSGIEPEPIVAPNFFPFVFPMPEFVPAEVEYEMVPARQK